MKTRYFLYLAYNGAPFCGWQVQPGKVTVQSVICKAVSTILGEETTITGAGRTDTGVHASFYCAHFESILPGLDNDDKFIFRLNSFLPQSISVSRIRKVVPDGHARFSAISRTYKYYISRVKDPFCGDMSWYIYGKIDAGIMNKACTILMKHDDFTSFSRLHSGAKTNICRIIEAFWQEDDDKLIFTITADRFLRNMVRAITGTMIDLGQEKMSLKDFEEVIMSRDRGKAGKSAPARGLFLSQIEYPVKIFL